MYVSQLREERIAFMLRGFKLLNFHPKYNIKMVIYSGFLFSLTYLLVIGVGYSLSDLKVEAMLTTSIFVFAFIYLLNSYTNVSEYYKSAIQLQKHIGIRVIDRTLWCIIYCLLSFLVVVFTTSVVFVFTNNSIFKIINIIINPKTIIMTITYLIMYIPVLIIIFETLTVKTHNIFKLAFKLIVLGLFVILSVFITRYFYFKMSLYTFVIPISLSILVLKIVDYIHYYKMEV